MTKKRNKQICRHNADDGNMMISSSSTLASKDDVVAAALADSSHVAHRAVSLGFLLEFTESNDCWNLPTQDVMLRYIIPRMMDPSSSSAVRYSDLLSAEQVGTVTVFVSHTWSNPWGLLVGSARKFANDFKKHHPNSLLFFWVDLFAIPQQARCKSIQQHDLTQLGVVVQMADNILVVCDDQIKPLTRVWCLFEVVIGLQSGPYGKVQLRCGTMTAEGNQFIPIHDGEKLRTMADQLDLCRAGATLEEDRERIFQLIQSLFPKQGMADVNRIIKRALRRGWS